MINRTLIKHPFKLTGYLSLAIAILFLLAFFILIRKNTIAPTLKTDKPALSPESVSISNPSLPKVLETTFPDRICNISNYGASVNNESSNTKAIAAAIDDCANDGGGRVVIPPGIWLTGPIKLRSNINLEIQKDAELRFNPEPDEYLPVVFSRFEGIEYYNYSPPIYAKDCENIAITGAGTLNGQGEKIWWNFSSDPISLAKLYSNIPVEERIFGTVKDGFRPSFLEFVNCQKILIDGITAINGPMWTIHPIYSQDIIIKNVTIKTNPGPSTDGIAIDSSRNILIDTSTFTTGDDAIVIKSGRDEDGRRVGKPSENILIQNCHIINAHGAVAIGSEMSGGVKNVFAQNINIDQAQYAFRIKSNSDRGGSVENIWVNNFKAKDISQAVIQLNMLYDKNILSEQGDFPPVFQNIHISDFSCDRSNADSINISGLRNNTIKNIELKNITIGKSRSRLRISDTQDIKLEKIVLNPKYGPVFDLTNCQDITISNSPCQPNMSVCLSVSGSASRNITIFNNDFDQAIDKIVIDKEINRNEIKIRTNPEIKETN